MVWLGNEPDMPSLLWMVPCYGWIEKKVDKEDSMVCDMHHHPDAWCERIRR